MSRETQRYTRSMCVRLSPQELDTLKREATQAETSVPKLLRLRILYKRLPQKIIDISPMTYLELAYLSDQVNQAAKLAHQASCQAKLPPTTSLESVETALPEIETLLEQIETQMITLGLETQADELKESAKYDL